MPICDEFSNLLSEYFQFQNNDERTHLFHAVWGICTRTVCGSAYIRTMEILTNHQFQIERIKLHFTNNADLFHCHCHWIEDGSVEYLTIFVLRSIFERFCTFAYIHIYESERAQNIHSIAWISFSLALQSNSHNCQLTHKYQCQSTFYGASDTHVCIRAMLIHKTGRHNNRTGFFFRSCLWLKSRIQKPITEQILCVLLVNNSPLWMRTPSVFTHTNKMEFHFDVRCAYKKPNSWKYTW